MSDRITLPLLPEAIEFEVTLGRRRFVAGLRLCIEEHRRRQRAGLGGIDDYRSVFALWELPTGGTAALDQLPAPHAGRLVTLPSAAVRTSGGLVERVAISPIDIEYLIAVRGTCRAAFESFGDRWWAPVRVAVVPSAGRADLVRAARFGIGVFAEGEWKVAPVRRRPATITPLRWWQSELVYSQLIVSGQTIDAAVQTA